MPVKRQAQWKGPVLRTLVSSYNLSKAVLLYACWRSVAGTPKRHTGFHRPSPFVKVFISISLKVLKS